MKTTLGLFGLVLVLSACGRGVGAYSVPAEFAPYVESFQREAAARGKAVDVRGLRISFADLGSESSGAADVLGNCDTGTGVVHIDETSWAGLADAEREELVFHELGHCVLGRAHEDGERLVGGGFEPESIMNSHEVSFTLYESERAYYVDELLK